MLPLQKCLTMAAPSKQFIAPPMEKLRKAEGSVFPVSPDTSVEFSPAALEAKEGAFLALEEGDGSGIPWGYHLPSRTGKDRAGLRGRELVTGCGTKGNLLCMKYLTQTPLEEKPSDKIIEMGQRETISLPLIIPLNEEVVESVGHHKLFHVLDHLPVTFFGPPLPSFSHVVLEGIDNHVCCWVRPQEHVKPVIGPHGPARMADLGLHM